MVSPDSPQAGGSVGNQRKTSIFTPQTSIEEKLASVFMFVGLGLFITTVKAYLVTNVIALILVFIIPDLITTTQMTVGEALWHALPTLVWKAVLGYIYPRLRNHFTVEGELTPKEEKKRQRTTYAFVNGTAQFLGLVLFVRWFEIFGLVALTWITSYWVGPFVERCIQRLRDWLSALRNKSS
jgi:hypothetical protein